MIELAITFTYYVCLIGGLGIAVYLLCHAVWIHRRIPLGVGVSYIVRKETSALSICDRLSSVITIACFAGIIVIGSIVPQEERSTGVRLAIFLLFITVLVTEFVGVAWRLRRRRYIINTLMQEDF